MKLNSRMPSFALMCIAVLCLFTFMSCNNKSAESASASNIHLITLDPGHFHAALVQKYMYADVDSVVKVYAPPGNDLPLHLNRIKAYNTRQDDPTRWQEKVYSGNDFFEKMLAENRAGETADSQKNVVVLAGNNLKKTDYILESLQKGFNILGDKPMAIDSAGFIKLQQAFDVAAKNDLVLYDIMTERFEITSILLRELSLIPSIFGTLIQGTADDPAVVKHSVHYLYKHVSGNVLTRPPWFFDVAQEGEGNVDVMTHLVDLAQWECFPGQSIDFKTDIRVNAARHWTTDLALSEFKDVTKVDSFPAYLQNHVERDTLLKLYCNGEINYELKGIHVKTSIVWNYRSVDDTGDWYEAIMKGTRANLVIRQGAAQQHVSTLYIEPAQKDSLREKSLQEDFKAIQAKYPGVELQKVTSGWMVVIPEKYQEGHEEHFARVTKNFLEYLQNKNMPAWEVPGMLAKYYTTTKAFALANKK